MPSRGAHGHSEGGSSNGTHESSSPARSRCALLTILLPVVTCALVFSMSVEAQDEEDGRLRIESSASLPRPLDADEIDGLTERLRAAIVPVRTIRELPPGHHPRRLEGDGTAVLVRFHDGEEALVTSYAHVVEADEISVQMPDGDWIAVEGRRGSNMFDLVGLVPSEFSGEEASDASWAQLRALPLAQPTHAPEHLFVADARMLRRGARPSLASSSPTTEEGFRFYRRIVPAVRNGAPVTDAGGTLVSIGSLADPNVPGAMLAIPAIHIASWKRDWPQIEPDDPIGWSPRVERRSLQLRSGREALQGE